MVLEVIYVVRHGYRSNWVVDPSTGTYTATVRSPTGIPSDPALASYGVEQANQLAEKILSLDPPVDVVYSSPFYRCLQTIKPAVERMVKEGREAKVRVENGLGEFYGLARFDHPSPAPLSTLQSHFPTHLHPSYASLIVPSVNGESIAALHDRIAYTLHRIIEALDADPSAPRALLICTHAASMICIGRVLTGRMPEDANEEDFRCGTCALSQFVRRTGKAGEGVVEGEVEIDVWDKSAPERIPKVHWEGGRGVKGGWDCVVNGDCSFLSGGEERTWNFWMEEQQAHKPALSTAAEAAAEAAGAIEAAPAA